MEKRVDDLGRVVLPYEYRDQYGFHKGDKIDVRVEGDAVIMRRITRRCVLCGETNEQLLHREGDKDICENCILKLIQGGQQK